MELLLFAAYIITVHHGLLCYVNQLSGPKSHVSVAKRPINNATVKFGLNAVHDHDLFVDFPDANKLVFILNG